MVRSLATALAVLAPALAGPVVPPGVQAKSRSITTTIAAPPTVWPEAGALVRLAPTRLTIRVHGEPRVRRWAAFAFPHSSATTALRAVAAGLADGALVDRALTAAERRSFRSFRTVPLFLDADVVLGAPGEPLCRDGVALGTVAGWLQPGGAPPQPLVAPAMDDGAARPLFGAPPAEPPLRVLPEPAAVEAAARGEALALVAWSAARTALETRRVCAVPVGGVAPAEATIRDGSYPAARRVSWAYRRWPPRVGSRSERTAWLRFLRSGRLRAELGGGDGRRRLVLPG